jgi:hypothetical protein
VTDRPGRALAGLPLFPKWEGLDRLADELERAQQVEPRRARRAAG